MSETIERQTIKIDNTEYYLDSLTEKANGVLADIHIVDSELRRVETTFNITRLAKEHLSNRLVEDIAEFEKVPVEENDSAEVKENE